MSKLFQYFAPFAAAAASVPEQGLQDFLNKAATSTVRSFDGVPVRATVASDTRGFLPIKIRFEDYGLDVIKDSMDEIAEILGQSEVRGVRGVRGVLIDSELVEEGDEVVVTAWIGRNIWFNQHRVTAGYPDTENQRGRVLSDLDTRFANEFHEIFVEVVDAEDEEDAAEQLREKTITHLASLRDELNDAIAALRACDADPEDIVTALLDTVDEWSDEAEEIVQA